MMLEKFPALRFFRPIAHANHAGQQNACVDSIASVTSHGGAAATAPRNGSRSPLARVEIEPAITSTAFGSSTSSTRRGWP
jgi:hypothetical protein